MKFLLFSLTMMLASELTAQRVFVASTHSMPVIDAGTYTADTVLTGFNGGVVREIAVNSTKTHVFAGTDYFQPTKKLLKFNADSYALEETQDISSYVFNLEISPDDQTLFYNGTSSATYLYSADAGNLTQGDSIDFTPYGGIRDFELIDANTALVLSSFYLLKTDLGTSQIMDTLEIAGGIQSKLNPSKTKLAISKIFNNSLIIVDVPTFSIDTTIILNGMAGDPSSVGFNADGSAVLIASVGSNVGANDGGLRVFNTSDYSEIFNVNSLIAGVGNMSIAPDGKVWIPRNTDKAIEIYNPVTNTLETPIDFTSYSNAAPYEAVFVNGSVNSIEELGVNLDVSPNPFKDIIHFNETLLDASIQLFSLNGQLVYEDEHFNGNMISLERFPKGVYFLDITTPSYSIQKKIIKE